MNQFTDSDA
jgi:hypothetical protein